MSHPYQGQPPQQPDNGWTPQVPDGSWIQPPTGAQPPPQASQQPAPQQPAPQQQVPFQQGAAPAQPAQQPVADQWAGQQQQTGWSPQTASQPSASAPQHTGWSPQSASQPSASAPQAGWTPQTVSEQSAGGYAQTAVLPATGAGPWNPQGPAKNSKKPILIGGIAVLVLALLIGGGFFVKHQNDVKAAEKAAAEAQAELDRQVTAATAVVQGFYDALVAGDATKALSFAEKPPSGPLLTNEAYAPAAKALPLTEVSVETAVVTKDANGQFTTAEVTSSYKIGGKVVNKDWELSMVNGDWKLDQVTGKITFSPVKDVISEDSLPTLVNGVAASESVDALPGQYTVAPASKNIVFKTTKVVVTEPGEEATWQSEYEAAPAALQAAAAAIKASYDKCLASKSVSNPGCPNHYNTASVNGAIKPETVKFTVTGNPFSTAKYVSGADQLVLRLTITLGVTFDTATTRYTGRPTANTWDATYDFNAKSVRWQKR